MKKDLIVKTYDGSLANASECRRIKGNFYKKHEQCFYLNGRWYRINSGFVEKDYENGEYYLKSDPHFKNTISGIVDIDVEQPKIGRFTPNELKNVDVVTDIGIQTAIDEFVLRKAGYSEHKGVYYDPNQVSLTTVDRYIERMKRNLHSGSPYRVSNVIAKHNVLYERANENRFIHPSLHVLKNYLPYSFGAEFETTTGVVPTRFCAETGLVPLRDGSIQGIEYTTIPLSGVNGIQALLKAAEYLAYYTTISIRDSFHLHLGGYPKTIKSIVALYNLAYLVQDSIFRKFPKWARNSTVIGKDKNYTAPLPNLYKAVADNSVKNNSDLIMMRMSNIYYYLSGGLEFFSLSDEEHPKDPNNSRKWNIRERYHYCNLIPLVFGKSRTVESRIHGPTTNPVKVLNWLLINTAILKYAEKYMDELAVTSITSTSYIDIYTILQEVYPCKIYSVLINYLQYREADISKMEKTDRYCHGEITNDSADLDKFNVLRALN